jgi:hypothetical protein
MRLALLVAFAALVPSAVQAPICNGPGPCQPPPLPESSRGEHLVESAAINAGLGGLGGGALAALRGGSFLRGFLQGAAGGGLTYAGKTIAAARWQGAGLVGRQVAAVGSSVSLNAAEGRAPLSRVVLPAGPLRVYVDTDRGVRARPRLDLAGLITLAAFASESGARFDLGASLSDGAPVFRVTAGDARGRHFAGVLAYVLPADATAQDSAAVPDARSHERVHVIQNDQVFMLIGRPLDDLLVGERRGLLRWLDPGVHTLMIGTANALIDHGERPWEHEAYLISDTREEGR